MMRGTEGPAIPERGQDLLLEGQDGRRVLLLARTSRLLSTASRSPLVVQLPERQRQGTPEGRSGLQTVDTIPERPVCVVVELGLGVPSAGTHASTRSKYQFPFGSAASKRS